MSFMFKKLNDKKCFCLHATKWTIVHHQNSNVHLLTDSVPITVENMMHIAQWGTFADISTNWLQLTVHVQSLKQMAFSTISKIKHPVFFTTFFDYIKKSSLFVLDAITHSYVVSTGFLLYIHSFPSKFWHTYMQISVFMGLFFSHYSDKFGLVWVEFNAPPDTV